MRLIYYENNRNLVKMKFTELILLKKRLYALHETVLSVHNQFVHKFLPITKNPLCPLPF